MPRAIYRRGRSPWYLLHTRVGGLQSRCGRFGADNNLFPCRESSHSFPVFHCTLYRLSHPSLYWRWPVQYRSTFRSCYFVSASPRIRGRVTCLKACELQTVLFTVTADLMFIILHAAIAAVYFSLSETCIKQRVRWGFVSTPLQSRAEGKQRPDANGTALSPLSCKFPYRSSKRQTGVASAAAVARLFPHSLQPSGVSADVYRVIPNIYPTSFLIDY